MSMSSGRASRAGRGAGNGTAGGSASVSDLPRPDQGRVRVRLLGGFEVWCEDRPISGFESQKVRALLAYLISNRHRAFSRDHREEEGYLLPITEVVRRAQEAWDLGATEVCIQAGLPPKLARRPPSIAAASFAVAANCRSISRVQSSVTAFECTCRAVSRTGRDRAVTRFVHGLKFGPDTA